MHLKRIEKTDKISGLIITTDTTGAVVLTAGVNNKNGIYERQVIRRLDSQKLLTIKKAKGYYPKIEILEKYFPEATYLTYDLDNYLNKLNTI